MDKMYPDATEEDKLCRAWIREQLISATVLYKDLAVEFDGSNTSGNSLTAVLNNFANQILVLFVLSTFQLSKAGVEYSPDIIDYDFIDEHLRMCTLGDDVVLALGPLFDGIDSTHFAKILGRYNIKITNGDKSDPLINIRGLRSLAEMTFLKRGFILIEGEYVAPLDKKSISKMVQWTKKGLELREQQNVIQDAIYEISIHGEAFYDECMKKLLPAMVKFNGGNDPFAPKYPTWRSTFERTKTLEHTWEA
jgi:hypothetical protein